MSSLSLPSSPSASSLPVTSELELVDRVAELVGRACRRQLWVLFFDEELIQLPLIVPIEEYPSMPSEQGAEMLVDGVAGLIDAAAAVAIAIVWERRLGEAATPADRSWAVAVAAGCRARGIRLLGQLLSHRRGVRALSESECLPASRP